MYFPPRAFKHGPIFALIERGTLAGRGRLLAGRSTRVIVEKKKNGFFENICRGRLPRPRGANHPDGPTPRARPDEATIGEQLVTNRCCPSWRGRLQAHGPTMCDPPVQLLGPIIPV